MTLQELYEAAKQDLENGYDPNTPVVVELRDEDGRISGETADVRECYYLKGVYWIGVK
jgi:hypothetical protein